MRRWMFLVAAGMMMAMSGCSAVQEGTQKARAVAVKTGNRLESGAGVARVKARSWWQRLFGGGDESGSGSSGSRRKVRATPSSNGRYQPIEPQYVGTEAGS